MDAPPTAARSRLMRAIRAKDTKPEMAVRRLLHAMGFRFRLHRRDLPGRPDVVLPRLRAAVFVHGCFWHRHDCPRVRLPRTRAAFWADKLARNQARDAAAVAALGAQGWRVLVVWECETGDADALRARLAAFLAADAPAPADAPADTPGTGPATAPPAAARPAA